jgi:hypothetical protein
VRSDVARALRGVVRDEVPPPVEGLLPAAEYHGIVSLLRSLVPTLPGVSEAFLNEQGVRMRALADLELVAELLGDVAWAVVKGPVLSEVVYRQRGQRGFSDLDVLVDPSVFGSAVADLEAAGAVLLDRNWQLAHRQQRAELSLRLPKGTVLDLHWSLINHADTRRLLRLPSMLEDRVPVVLGSVPTFRLAPVDGLLHVCLHAVLSGGHRLVWVRDVIESLYEVPPANLLDRAASLGVTLPVATMLSRTAAVTGSAAVDVPGPWGVLMSAGARWLPPGRGPRLRPTGATVVAATRVDTASSVRALTRRFADRSSLRISPDELVRPVDDGWRERYLSSIG